MPSYVKLNLNEASMASKLVSPCGWCNRLNMSLVQGIETASGQLSRQEMTTFGNWLILLDAQAMPNRGLCLIIKSQTRFIE